MHFQVLNCTYCKADHGNTTHKKFILFSKTKSSRSAKDTIFNLWLRLYNLKTLFKLLRIEAIYRLDKSLKKIKKNVSTLGGALVFDLKRARVVNVRDREFDVEGSGLNEIRENLGFNL